MEPVTILTPTDTTDDYNNPVSDWSDADEADEMALIEPIDGQEFGPGEVPLDRARVYLRSGVEVSSLCRIVARGRTWDVVAPVADWRSIGSGGVVVEVAAVVGADVEVGS